MMPFVRSLHLKMKILPERKGSNNEDAVGAAARDEKRREVQREHQHELDEASEHIKRSIRQYEETETKSRMEHVLTQWLLESRQLYGQFPVYPPADANGSATLFKEMTVAEVQEFINKVHFTRASHSPICSSSSRSKRKR